jgi:hypothetical protein
LLLGIWQLRKDRHPRERRLPQAGQRGTAAPGGQQRSLLLLLLLMLLLQVLQLCHERHAGSCI